MQRRDVADARRVIVGILGRDHLTKCDALARFLDEKHWPFGIGDPLRPERRSIGEVRSGDDIVRHDAAVGDVPRFDVNASNGFGVAAHRAPDRHRPSFASHSSSERGQSAFSKRDSERSARTRPPVWQVAQ